MQIVPAKHLTQIAAHANPMDVESELFEVGSDNYLDVAFKVHTLYAVGTPPTPHTIFDVWGTNDGVTFYQISGITADRTTSGLSHVSGFVTAALIRFHFALTLTGSNPGDWATAILCCHANITSR